MYIAILGRQPALGVAELERVYGAEAVRWFSDSTATVIASSLQLDCLGGCQKAGRVVFETKGNWLSVSRRIITHYSHAWQKIDHKITLGISAYELDVSPREVQKTGLVLKKALRTNGVSLRLVPNATSALNTATSHHNRLGLSDNHVELLVVRGASGKIIVAESVGAQNITAYARRDRDRPRRDAFVGMLPPKLAQIMVNLACGETAITPVKETVTGVPNPIGQTPQASARKERSENDATAISPIILDPFCGTGTVLQEALLKGFTVYGSDLSQKMVDYTTENLQWLTKAHRHTGTIKAIRAGDATIFTWPEAPELTAVVCETYLGQPFSAPPKPEKLKEVVGNCNHIISEFLKNIHPQLTSGTLLCIAVPAWRDNEGRFTHLPLVQQLEHLGYHRNTLQRVNHDQLLYYRENQIVARELLILTRY